MSHELDFTNNRANMAYVGDLPWHGLGQKLEAGASIETWREAAGMRWRIQRATVRYATAHGMTPDDFSTVDDRFVLLRSDSKKALGIVSNQYEVVQPAQVLEFFRDLTESAGYVLNTAGCLFDGKRFWALADTGDSGAVGDKRDVIKRHLLLSTSCDGSMATEARYTDIRVVCHNTLSAARYAKADIKVSHKLKFDADVVKRQLNIGTAHDSFSSTVESFRQMADTAMSPADMAMATATLFNPKAAEMAKADLQKLLNSKPVTRTLELATGRARGAEFSGAHGTAWAWLNGVTEYVDHEARAQSQDGRLVSAWFGKGNSLKETAFEIAMTGAGNAVRVAYQDTPQSDAPSGLLDDVLANTVNA